MGAVNKRLGWLLVFLVYATLLSASYFLEFGPGLFFLTLPWSTFIAIFGWLIIHASSIDFDTYLLFAGIINSILLLSRVFKRYDEQTDATRPAS